MIIKNKYHLFTISIFLCSTHLNFGMDRNCFTHFFGSDDAPQQQQAMLNTLTKKIGYSKPLRLKVMNQATENQVDEDAIAFVAPNSNKIYIHQQKFEILPKSKQLEVLAHEIYHFVLGHPRHRKWEKESWLTMLQSSIPPLALSCLPGIPKAIHKKFLTLGASLFFGSMTKGIYLDNSSWYKILVGKWYNYQETQAQEKAENLLKQKK